MQSTNIILAQAHSYSGIRAGVARVTDVLEGLSYQAARQDQDLAADVRTSLLKNRIADWPSLLVLGLRHPRNEPALDWWECGNTEGNRRVIRIGESMSQWLRKEHGIASQPLPYHVERGGVFLKDAAAIAGLGVIGRNNLLIHPDWGPRIRLKAMLIGVDLDPTPPVSEFSPCSTCPDLCMRVCPQDAFFDGRYHRSSCGVQMRQDIENREASGEVIKYCRACELVCPVNW